MGQRTILALAVSALGLVFAGGCSLFTNLDVDGYVPADAAPPTNQICYADVCRPVALGCLVNPTECGPSAQCCFTTTSSAFQFACCAVESDAGAAGH